MQFRTKCTLLFFLCFLSPYLPSSFALQGRVGGAWLAVSTLQSAGLSSSLGSGQLSVPGYSLRASTGQGLLLMYHSKTIISSGGN